MTHAVMKQIIEYINKSVAANKGYAHIWSTQILWTWQWWFELVLTIGPIIIWFIFRKRDSTGRLLYVGFFALIIISWLDLLGNSYKFWYYPFKLIPTFPPFFPWDTLMSIEIMFLIQYKPTFSPWLKSITFGLVNAFVGEPVMKLLGLYVLVHWKHIYSFPVYIVIYLLAHRMAQSKTFDMLYEM
ncbi:hypothetical protein LSG31_05335 [Fodinisporobacter ferrooxydans]|uniref:Uncharacterized protein n=1 Tax=Fodinisporobacter ferrooxydans TaxID=2901836 RepID=A0ABY4CMN5_9BACL|nr:hypothetical protein LSG31_05335 [Alicyclobacillaceae bacterium MYW30-H2]